VRDLAIAVMLWMAGGIATWLVADLGSAKSGRPVAWGHLGYALWAWPVAWLCAAKILLEENPRRP